MASYSGDNRHMKTDNKRHQQRYDHRLRELVRQSGNPDLVAHLGVPRSTAISWLTDEARPVVTGRIIDMGSCELQAEILTLRARVQKLSAIIRLLRVLIRLLGIRLDQTRLPEGEAKARLLGAIDRSKDTLSLKGALKVLGLSFFRSNSMIEAWWRGLKHQWLYLNTLDTRAVVERLVAFYVVEHNTKIPHSAFRGEIPEEMYTGQGADVAERLSMAKKQARIDRITVNQAQTCLICQPDTHSQEFVGMVA